MALVTREELRGVLGRWLDGGLPHQELYDWSTQRFGLEQMESGDPVVNEILAHLDIMDINLTTPDDVPVFLRMLEEPSETEAVKILAIHGDQIDLDERMAKWKHDPFYAPFCHRPGQPVA